MSKLVKDKQVHTGASLRKMNTFLHALLHLGGEFKWKWQYQVKIHKFRLVCLFDLDKKKV